MLVSRGARRDVGQSNDVDHAADRIARGLKLALDAAIAAAPASMCAVFEVLQALRWSREAYRHNIVIEVALRRAHMIRLGASPQSVSAQKTAFLTSHPRSHAARNVQAYGAFRRQVVPNVEA